MTDTDPVELTSSLKELLGNNASDVENTYVEFYKWMLKNGKNPRRNKGLGESTAGNYIDRFDQLHRFVIRRLDEDIPIYIKDEQADAILRMIDQAIITKQRGQNSGEEYGESAKRKFSNVFKMYFKWRYYTGTMEYEWEPKINFSDTKGESAYRFPYRELGLLFNEAQNYGSLPSYYDVSDDERESINGLVAQRLGIKKENVTRDHWLEADWSRKVHALIRVGFDAGLAPIEVENFEVDWYDPQAKTLTIPSEFACKERNKEKIALSDETAEALSEWIQERRHLAQYDGTNKVWLNRAGNPYQSGSLCRLLRKLCEQADIQTEGKKIVWYSLRKTMGTNVTSEGELSEANDQLRHDRLSTTQEGYNQTPEEKLRARLNEVQQKAEKAATDPDYNPYEENADANHPSSVDKTVQVQNSSENVVTELPGGEIHIDTTIEDTTEARVDITQKILDNETEE